MNRSPEVAALLRLQIIMVAEIVESGVCESLHIHHRALPYTNTSAADFIENVGTGTVVDLGNGSSASS